MDPRIVLTSFLVGLLIGLTSMGGAALMAPFLILGIGLKPVMAVRTDLVYGAITKIFGSVVHWRLGTIDFSVAFKMALGSVPAGLVGVAMVAYLEHNGVDADAYIKRGVGVMLILVGSVLLLRIYAGDFLTSPGAKAAWVRSYAPLWGAAVGFCVGLTSVGSGSLVVPFLMLIFPANPARAVGTDVFHAAILVTATGAAHGATGPVEWGLVGQLLLGSVPGVLLGSNLAPRLPAQVLRAGLALILLATGVQMAA